MAAAAPPAPPDPDREAIEESRWPLLERLCDHKRQPIAEMLRTQHAVADPQVRYYILEILAPGRRLFNYVGTPSDLGELEYYGYDRGCLVEETDPSDPPPDVPCLTLASARISFTAEGWDGVPPRPDPQDVDLPIYMHDVEDDPWLHRDTTIFDVGVLLLEGVEGDFPGWQENPSLRSVADSVRAEQRGSLSSQTDSPPPSPPFSSQPYSPDPPPSPPFPDSRSPSPAGSGRPPPLREQ